jgi:hypothetical protein
MSCSESRSHSIRTTSTGLIFESEKGGFPILLTSMDYKTINSKGRVINSPGNYPDAVRQPAKEENVPLIALNAMSKTLYKVVGSKDCPRHSRMEPIATLTATTKSPNVWYRE